MLPNPVNLLAMPAAKADGSRIYRELAIEPLVRSTSPILCNKRPITVEVEILSIVGAALDLARLALGKPDSWFDIEVQLTGTDQYPDFCVDFSYLEYALDWMRYALAWTLETEILSIDLTQQGANSIHDRPSLLTVGFHRPIESNR